MKKRKKKKNKKQNTSKSLKMKYNIILITLILIIIMPIIFYFIDRNRVLNLDKRPIFAIKTGVYSDGGSTEYIGIGYKVIMYKQLIGRYDNEIGSWKLKFVDKPTKINLLDFVIEYTDNPKKTYKKYKGAYITITEKPYFIDEKNNVIRFQYTDPDGKYTTAIDFYLMYQPAVTYKDKNEKITVVGIVDNFRNKTKESAKGIIVKNAFVKDQ